MKHLRAFRTAMLGAALGALVACGGSSSDKNLPPLPLAGADQSVPVGTLVTVDGSGSVDPEGETLRYSWSFDSVPAASSLTDADLSSTTVPSPTFTPDAAGTFVLSLEVNDGESTSTDFVYVLAGIPTADAGFDQTVQTGTLVTLDGSNSSIYGAGGGALTYLWSVDAVPAGSSITSSSLSSQTAVNPSFTPDKVGTYGLSLVVNDGVSDSAADQVSIVTANSRPTADAGPDQLVTTTTLVTLDGSASDDVDSDALTYLWSLFSVPPLSAVVDADLSSTTAVGPTFTTDVEGNYVLSLVVNDGFVDSLVDYVVIAAGLPLADAGPDQLVTTGTLVSLDGSGSQAPGGGGLIYLWSFDSVPAGSFIDDASLSSQTAVNPTFTPDVDGEYFLSLVVNDGAADSTADQVKVTASIPLSSLTFADAVLEACVTSGSATHVVEVTALNCTVAGIADLGGIENLTSLRILHLGSNFITDLSPLAGLTGLTTLSLGSNGIADISALSGLTNLTVLGLSFNNIADISALSGLTELTTLGLDYNNIADISALSGLTSLTSLGLTSNSITDLSALSGLTGLTHLYLDYNAIADIQALSGLTALIVLSLDNNSISDIQALTGLTALTSLQLEYNSIGNLPDLSGLSGLTSLGLRANNISDISGLSGLTSLEWLDLYLNNLSDISPLSGMTNLYYLDLAANNISDVSVLSGKTTIRRLSLHSNNLSDISALAGLTNLVRFYVNDNNISDISVMSGMTGLVWVYLHNNSITDVSALSAATGMIDLNLSNNSITVGVASLVTLTRATSIDLEGNNGIPCVDLATLTGVLPGVVIEPATCQ